MANPKKSILISARIDEDLKKRIDRYIAGQDLPPQLSTLVQVALKEFMDKRAPEGRRLK